MRRRDFLKMFAWLPALPMLGFLRPKSEPDTIAFDVFNDPGMVNTYQSEFGEVKVVGPRFDAQRNLNRITSEQLDSVIQRCWDQSLRCPRVIQANSGQLEILERYSS